MSFRTYFEVGGADRSDLGAQVGAQRRRVAERLDAVVRVVAVMSGKGGVGKSTTTAGVAVAAAERGLRVGALDADLRSPTLARLLGAEGPLDVTDDAVVPAVGQAAVRVISSDFLLEDGQPLTWREPGGERFVWRGALETGALREFLGHVAWGTLDLLLVDLPPGADGVADLHQLVPTLTGAVAVTIPTDASRRSVARAMQAARDDGIPLLGVVENMSGYFCDGCAAARPLFDGHAGEDLAAAFDVPLIACVPFAPSAAAPTRLWAAVVDRVLGAGS